ncbi:MAG: hypothetical protein Q8O40_17490 [Chloroflexota bacterium]|nr:hypothetical protein [Chloroflexota bacterium]
MSHVGVMVDSVDIVESLTTTVRRAFQPAKGTWAARRNALTDGERKAIVTKALSYAGRRYGWLKLIAHAVDYLLFRSRYVARRFLFMDNYPICSWVVAYSYQAAGLSFGVPANQADPDDIWDWVEGHPEEWHLMEVGICPDRR